MYLYYHIDFIYFSIIYLKIVFIYLRVKDSHTLPPLVEVFSVKTGAWRGIISPAPLCHITGNLWRQGFVHGAAHWVAYPPNCGRLRSLILSFDMCDEVFREIMLPECLAGESPWYMGVIRYLL